MEHMTGGGAKVRLYVADDLAAERRIALASGQSHYAMRVMRLGVGDAVALFNGRDGEWLGRIDSARRGGCVIVPVERRRAQAASPDLWLVFAPVKRVRIDYMAAKATELGVSALWPVLTRNTAVSRVNVGRLQANAIEAAEQCGRLDVPAVTAPADFDAMIAQWPAGRRILLCDESGAAPPLAEVLAGIAADAGGGSPGPWAVLTGPEGGFARSELDGLAKLPFVSPAGLGPRILRADTAAVAALACWQALVGDWRGGEATE